MVKNINKKTTRTATTTEATTNLRSKLPRVLLILSLGITLFIWKQEKRVTLEQLQAAGKRVASIDPKLTISTDFATAAASTNDAASRYPSGLVCWRQSNTSATASRYFLVTGCGYSSTGFISKAFLSQGYIVGHELIGNATDGLSAWPAATGHHYDWAPASSFKHIFLLVRHPFKVLRSKNGTNWNFRGYQVEDHVSTQPAEAFFQMQWQFRTLDWWYSYTAMGETLAECYYRIEDMTGHLMHDICTRSELPRCDEKNWNATVQQNKGYNKHWGKEGPAIIEWSMSWNHLKEIAQTPQEQMVLEKARTLCRHFEYEDC